MAMPKSCPVPGLTEPSLVFTVPETFASLASLLELDPTRPACRSCGQLLNRLSRLRFGALLHGRPRHCPPTLMSWKVQETQRRVRHRRCSVLPDRALEECMACAPVLDEAAIPERLVAVDLGQPSWGSAKSSQQAYSDSTPRHERFASYPHSVRNVRRSSAHTGSSVIRPSPRLRLCWSGGDNKSGMPRMPAWDIPDEPEPRRSDRELYGHFVAVRVDRIPYLGHQNGENLG
jgi:hypothetical protein